MEFKLTSEDWLFYKKLKSGKSQCLVCPRYCALLENEIGWCGARWNQNGEIKPRTYGLISSLAVDPIEKKPLYHFLPGTGILSFGSHGCNMECLNCQNYSISMERSVSRLQKKDPSDIIKIAQSKKVPSIASTYNEPMIAFEYIRDIANLADEKNLKMVVVDNGYINKDLALKLGPLLDAANIDIKGFSDEFYKEICGATNWKAILTTCSIFKELNVHLEITNLIIPTKNDSDMMIEELCTWIFENLGPNTPIHFSRFHPDYKLLNLPLTPLNTLEKAYKIAKDVGLNYIYLGNVRTPLGSNTFCHICNNPLIIREGYHTEIVGLSLDGLCQSCGTDIPIIL